MTEQDKQRAQDALLGKSPESLGPSYYHRTRGKTFRHPRPSDSGRVPRDLVSEFGLITGADHVDSKESEALSAAFASLPPKAQKAALKRIKSKAQNFNALYDVMLGLPSRIRAYVRKVWKREDKWDESWDKIASEMAGSATKILSARVDIIVYTPMSVISGKIDRGDPRLLRMARAQEECDALLCIYAHYFTVGVTSHISTHCMSYNIADAAIAGIADVADYGAFDHSARKARQQIALKAVDKNGWKLPVREKKK